VVLRLKEPGDVTAMGLAHGGLEEPDDELELLELDDELELLDDELDDDELVLDPEDELELPPKLLEMQMTLAPLSRLTMFPSMLPVKPPLMLTVPFGATIFPTTAVFTLTLPLLYQMTGLVPFTTKLVGLLMLRSPCTSM
jgi:hypothetical protein